MLLSLILLLLVVGLLLVAHSTSITASQQQILRLNDYATITPQALFRAVLFRKTRHLPCAQKRASPP